MDLIGDAEEECIEKLKTSDASQVSGGSLMWAKKQIVTSGHPLAYYLRQTFKKQKASSNDPLEVRQYLLSNLLLGSSFVLKKSFAPASKESLRNRSFNLFPNRYGHIQHSGRIHPHSHCSEFDYKPCIRS